jgi:hypothetical protein
VIEHSPHDTLDHVSRSWEWAIREQDAEIVETNVPDGSGARHSARNQHGVFANRLVTRDQADLAPDLYPEPVQRKVTQAGCSLGGMCHPQGFFQMSLESGSVRQARERIRPKRRLEPASLLPQAICKPFKTGEYVDRRWLGEDEAEVIRVDPRATDLLMHEIHKPGVTDGLDSHRNADGSTSWHGQRASTKPGEQLLHKPSVALRQESMTPHAPQKPLRDVLDVITISDAQADFAVVAGRTDRARLGAGRPHIKFEAALAYRCL